MTIPIFFARSNEGAPDLSREPVIQRVLVPMDGSELAEQVLAPVIALDMGSQIEYTLLRVVGQMTSLKPEVDFAQMAGTRRSLLVRLQELDREDRTQAAEYLDQIAVPLRARQFTVHTQVASSERPAEVILAHASAHSVDLIALATRGQSGLKRMLLGSVADKVLRGANTSVLMYSPIDNSSADKQQASVAQGA
jgi:nucleotide-binding universal stress UspA family protein